MEQPDFQAHLPWTGPRVDQGLLGKCEGDSGAEELWAVQVAMESLCTDQKSEEWQITLLCQGTEAATA